MRCEQVWDLLSAYADNETTGDEAAIVETHIAVCSECAADLHFMHSASGALGLAPQVEPPASLRASILAATVYRPAQLTWQQRLQSAWAACFTFRTIRYSALAGSAAMAAWLAVRVTTLPVVVPTNPGGVRTPAATAIAPKTHPAADVPDPSALFSKDLTAGIEIPPFSASKRIAAESTERRQGTAASSPFTPVTTRANALYVTSTGNRTTKPGSVSTVSSPADNADADAVEPSVDMLPPASGRSDVANTGAGRDSDLGETAALPTPSTVHVALASSTESAPRTQLITLADLKRSLRRQAMDDRSRFITESINEKRIRFDVVRSRF